MDDTRQGYLTDGASRPLPWLMLISRSALFAGWQALFALVAWLAGHHNPWVASAGWWPLSAALGSTMVIALLVRIYRRGGRRYTHLFRFDRHSLKSDWPVLLGILVLSGPIAFLPNILSAQWLFGNQQAALTLLIRPLPLWAGLASLVLFPVSVALSELPAYFAYVMPRLEAQTRRAWLAVLLPAVWLAVQHMFLPLVFDFRFMAWRVLMFLPFALMLAVVLRWRPRLLPYLVVVHGLMDLSTAAMILTAGK